MAFKIHEQDGAWTLYRETEGMKFPGLEIDYELYLKLHETREFDKHFHRVDGKLVKKPVALP